MIFHLLGTRLSCRTGYLPKNLRHPFAQDTFATANLAIRTEAFKALGGFDRSCGTGEDTDLCIRLAQTDWELFFQPTAVIQHKHRRTFSALLKQWYDYGKYHSYLFKKHSRGGLEIYLPAGLRGGVRALTLPLPFKAGVFLTAFNLFHFFFFLCAGAWYLGLRAVAVALVPGLLVSGWVYFFTDFSPARVKQWFQYSLIRYAVNAAYAGGAFWHGIKLGVLYIENTRDGIPPLADPKKIMAYLAGQARHNAQ